MPQNLSDMSIDEISLVDDPANEQARVLIVKAKKPKASANNAEEENETKPDAEGAADEMASLKKAVEDIYERVSALAPTGGNPDDEAAGGLAAASLKELHMDIETLSKALEDAEAKLDTLSKRADDAEAALEKANDVIKAKDAEIANLAKSNGGEEGDNDEEVVKSLPESIRKRIADAEAAAQAAQAEITKMREQTETAEAIAKAKALNVGDAEVVGPLLLRVSKGMTTAEDATALEGLLKGLSAQSSTAALFKSVGSDVAVDGDPEALLKAKASEIQTANKGMTYEAAYAKALEENPSLYNAYVAKRR